MNSRGTTPSSSEQFRQQVLAERERRLRAKAKALGLTRAEVEGTDAQILEAFARRYRSDYLGFTRLLRIDSKRGRVPFELNSVQKAYNAARTPRDVVLKARRVGMSTEAVSRDVHHLLTFDGVPAVNLVCQSIEGRQPVLTFGRMITIFFESLRERGLPLKFSKETASEWELEHRPGSLSIVEAGASKQAASKKGRGGRVTRLHTTEMSVWEFAGETLNALLECVDAPEFGTEIQHESTPNGAAAEDRTDIKNASGSSMFHWAVQDARNGVDGFKLHFVPWYSDDECKTAVADGEEVTPQTSRERSLVERGIGPEQLKWYQEKLAQKKSQDLVDQEYPSDPETCFLVSGRTFFDNKITGRLLDAAVDPIETAVIRGSGVAQQIVGAREVPALRIWHKGEPGRSYVIAADVSKGDGGDAGCGGVFERSTGRHMATLWGQFKPWELARYLVQVAKYYGDALIAVERNDGGGGGTCLRALDAEYHYPHIFIDRDGKPGWLNGPHTRAPALDALEQAHRDGLFKTNDRYMLAEMRTFIVRLVNNKARAEAKGGAHDDLVLMAAIAWDVICRPAQRTAGDIGLPVA